MDIFDLIIRIMINVSIGFIFILLISLASMQIQKRVNPFFYRIILGIGFGLTAWFTMYTAAHITNLPDLDLKLFLIAILAVLQGPLAALTATLMVLTYALIVGINLVQFIILFLSAVSAIFIGVFSEKVVKKNFTGRIWLVIFLVSLAAVLWKKIWLPTQEFNQLLNENLLPAAIFVLLTGFASSFMYLDRESRLNQVRDLKEKYQNEQKQRKEIIRLYKQINATKQELRTNYVEIETTFIDPLTGLPNKKAFNEKLTSTINHCHKTSGESPICGAVAFMDVDNFKLLNDSFGHSFGDQLLIQISERLKRSIIDGMFAARIGGDEFVFIFPDQTDIQTIEMNVKKFQDLFTTPFWLTNKEIQVNSSIGVVLYPLDGFSVEEIHKHADTALNQAKDRGRNQIVFFDSSMAQTASKRMNIEILLRSALLNRDFSLVYQPQYNIRTRELIGVEALLRWWNPELGQVSPTEFIPIAEESGLINELGKWVLDEACIMAKRLNREQRFPINVSVNISTKQVHLTEFVDDVIQIIRKHDLDPKWITLEITETVLMQSYDEIILKIKALTDFGVNIALDDFGTGYSSLSYLLSIPSTLIKIDRSFIQHMVTSERHVRLVSTIIDVAHDLNMDVLAEGVETEEQLGILQQYDCDFLQGFLFNKPLSEADLLLLAM